jgi:hypothetical protein
MIGVVGLALLAASFALLYLIRVPDGQKSARPEWFDVFLALLISSGITSGFFLVLSGLLA